EDDLINVCNRVYKQGYNEVQQKDFESGFCNTVINQFEEDWVAGHWRDWVEDILQSKNQKIEILCFNLQEEYQAKIAERRFIEANQLLVQVYRYEANIPKLRKPDGVLVAINLMYDPAIGYVDIAESIDERVD